MIHRYPAALLLFCIMSVPADAQSIKDPSFEIPKQGDFKFSYHPTGSAWTFTGGAGLAGNGSGFTGANPPAPQGSQVALLQNTAAISQAITDWPAGDYQISFKAAQRNYPQGGSHQIVSVLVDGETVAAIQPSGTIYQTYYTPSVTVTVGSHVLSFQSTGVGLDYTAFVDAVSIVPAGSVVPLVAASATVATSGKMLSFTFAKIADGKTAVPSQILATPSITVNGQPLGRLETSWVTSYHPVALMATPGGYQIRPGDLVRVTAPVGWAVTADGSVQAIAGVVAENRAGKPMLATESLPRTLRIGQNNPSNPAGTGLGFYMPWKNFKYRLGGWPPSNRGRIPGNWTLSIHHQPGNNSIDSTAYPGMAGLWLVMWDATIPATPVKLAIQTQTPAQCTVTERLDLARAPPDGMGCCRVFDVQPNPAALSANFDVSVRCDDPIPSNTQPHYANLWVVQPGDWDVVNGQVALDRSDPLAPSRIYLDRIGPNIGSIRWTGCTPGGANPISYPYPEMLPSLEDESWGDLAFYFERRGYVSAGPVDVNATPWIYSPLFRGADQNYPATLGAPVTTTPAPDTRETWTITDGATAPLMAGLEIKSGDEVCRIVSGSGTSWVVNRGSNGTTPAAHDAGPISVSGRLPITRVVPANGVMPRALLVQLTTRELHGRTTGSAITCNGVNWPAMTMTDGSTWNLQGMSRAVYVTGPNTMFMAIASANAGGVPDRVYPLDPNVQNWDFRAGGPLPYEAVAKATGWTPYADLHVNIPYDACDDMVYSIAQRVLANFPAGRRVYVEWMNEPWNWGYSGFYYLTGLMGPLITSTNNYQLAYYAMRSGEVHTIFRRVFKTAGRDGEIRGMINCQMGNGSTQILPALEYGLQAGTPFTDVGLSPYWNFEDTPYNRAVSAKLDDEQMIDVIGADMRLNPRFGVGWMIDANKAVDAFNAKHGTAVKIMAYEAGLDMACPWDMRRNHDLNYNPNWYYTELDWIAWCQLTNYDRVCISDLAQWWNPNGWGGYHTCQQRHGRGDGLNGGANNLLWRARTKPSNVNQDLHVDAVRPQAWLDWLGTLTQ